MKTEELVFLFSLMLVFTYFSCLDFLSHCIRCQHSFWHFYHFEQDRYWSVNWEIFKNWMTY